MTPHLGPLRHLQDACWTPLNHIHHLLSETCFSSSVSLNPERSKSYKHHGLPCFLPPVAAPSFAILFISIPFSPLPLPALRWKQQSFTQVMAEHISEVSFAFSPRPVQLLTPTELSFRSTDLIAALCSHSWLPGALHCSSSSRLAWCSV